VLHEAVCRLDIDIVNAILNSNSTDINLETYDGLTPLDMAISIGWKEGQRVLVRAGGRTAEEVRLDRYSRELITDMDWSVALTDVFSNTLFNLRYMKRENLFTVCIG